ncbi:MAG: acetyl-coenzyme A synthetase N-terminal domain-containing protein, partial [Deltaproteobacteria bacterium]
MPERIFQVLSTEKRVFPPSAAVRSRAHINSIEDYERLYSQSVNEPEKFWAEMAEANLVW